MTATMKLARCSRCQGATLLGDLAGLGIALDVFPVGDAAAFGAAVMGGRKLYAVEKRQNGALWRRTWALGSPVSFEGGIARPAGSQAVLYAEHPCPASCSRTPEVAPGPHPAPATPGERQGGSRPPAAPVAGAAAPASPSPASHVNHRPSRPPNCGICRKVMKPGEMYVAVEYPPGTYAFAMHEECE